VVEKSDGGLFFMTKKEARRRRPKSRLKMMLIGDKKTPLSSILRALSMKKKLEER